MELSTGCGSTSVFGKPGLLSVDFALPGGLGTFGIFWATWLSREYSGVQSVGLIYACQALNTLFIVSQQPKPRPGLVADEPSCRGPPLR